MIDSTRRQFLLSSGAAALAISPAAALATSDDADARALALLSDAADGVLTAFPERASGFGLDKDARRALKSRLTDRTLTGQQAIAAMLRRHVARLEALDRRTLSPSVRTNVDVVQGAFRLALDGFAFSYGDVGVGHWRNSPYVVIQNTGAFIDTPRLLDADHRIESKADAEAYLDRLVAYAGQLDGETERLRNARSKGVIAPDFLLDGLIPQLRTGRATRIEDWDVVASITRRAKSLDGSFGSRAAAIAADKVAPAFDRQIAELERHRVQANADAGVWKLPDGEAYYAWALRAGTTTNMTPAEVHQMGLDEMGELQGRMDTILKGLGYSKGSVAERMTALTSDPLRAFPDNDEGRAEIVAILRERMTHMRGLMPRAFNTFVRGDVEIRRLSPTEEVSAPSAYGGPGSPDGSIPSRLWINLRTTKMWNRASLANAAYHEGIPGHCWQGEYTFKLPLVRSLLQFNAYNEGWALYAEQLADELGAYDEDPVARLAYLQGHVMRASRLAVETGIHAKRWTRARAIDWFANANGYSADGAAGEIDRYCAWPGQSCGYKMGHSFINRQRERAKVALGSRYDFKAFNDAVVMAGDMPMTVLEQVVDRLIRASGGKK